MKKMKQNKGQIAIMVLLVSAIILTLGLSASKKAVTDTKVDTDEQLLKEAFNAAESGINNYILGGDNKGTYSSGNGSGAVVSSSVIGGGTTLASEGLIAANNNQLFWLVNHESNGDIGATYYSNDVKLTYSNFVGALKVDYFYIDSLNAYQVQHLACNYGGSTIIANPSPDCSVFTVAGKSPLLIVVTPLGTSTGTRLSLTGNGSERFPDQGEELTSVGTAGDGVKTQIRTRNIYQIPSFMLEAITAGNIVK